MTVLIAGGGIAGLALGLTCHQIGVSFKIFELVETVQPLGVGINLQPTAVRELYDLGFETQLDAIGVQTRDYGMYSKKGLQIWVEPRGTWAGYNWPQYSVHRGQLHMMLHNELIARAGHETLLTGARVTAFEYDGDSVNLFYVNRDGSTGDESGDLLIGADGIHSAIRKQMVPVEGEPKWSGAMLWRGTTTAEPFLSGASMVMIGHAGQRFVSYPISKPDSVTGKATINWIANLQHDPSQSFNKENYARVARIEDFLPQFQHLKLGWIDAPALIEAADEIFEYPMVDRDPIDRWTYGRASLMGDAAHAAYPVGSNGAGSAIIDARKIGAAFIEHGVTPNALQIYEAEMRPKTSKVVLMNRVAGPDSILDVIEERCGGQFDDIEDVFPAAEMAEHARKYKLVAGFGIDESNRMPQTIPTGARVGV